MNPTTPSQSDEGTPIHEAARVRIRVQQNKDSGAIPEETIREFDEVADGGGGNAHDPFRVEATESDSSPEWRELLRLVRLIQSDLQIVREKAEERD